MRILLKYLVASAAILTSVSALGESERWYKVELVVFEHLNPSAKIAELWLDQSDEPVIDDSIQLIPLFEDFGEKPPLTDPNALVEETNSPPNIPIPFQELPVDQLELKANWDALESNRAFQPLAHRAWIQPALESKTSGQVRITTEELEDSREQDLTATAEAQTESQETSKPNPTFSPLDSLSTEQLLAEGETQTSTPNALVKLDGTVRIRVSRYLHLDTELVFREPLSPEAAQPVEMEPAQIRAEQAGVLSVDDRPILIGADGVDPASKADSKPEPAVQIYRISEHRRIRSNELHYLDHPRFGMILKVTPVEVEIPTPALEDSLVTDSPPPN